MFPRNVRIWPLPAALAVCAVAATCAGAASHWVRDSQNSRSTRDVAATAPPAPPPAHTASAWRVRQPTPAAEPAPAAAPAPESFAVRRRANLVFLVDASARMNAPDKLPLVQRTMLETVGFLDGSDRVAIVRYAGDARVLLPPTPVSNRGAIMEVINNLAGETGATGSNAGLALAFAQASRSFVAGGINHVLLCTDQGFSLAGAQTSGPAAARDEGDAALARLVRDNRKAGVSLTVLRYGRGVLAREVADRLGHAGASLPPPIADDAQVHHYVRERLLLASEDGAAPRI